MTATPWHCKYVVQAVNSLKTLNVFRQLGEAVIDMQQHHCAAAIFPPQNGTLFSINGE
jgi:hypothetical protein